MTRQELIDIQTEYIGRIQAGSRQLIPELWELLRPLTARFIRRYIMQGQGERLYSSDDLWQESYIALVAALDYYKPELGGFATCYLWMIQRATRATRGTASKDAIFSASSLDEPIDSSGETEATRGDMVEDVNAGQGYEDAEQRAYLDALRKTFAEISDGQLTDEQRAIIQARYFDGLNLADTAAHLHKTAPECRQVEDTAIRIYRKPKNAARLKQFYIGYSGTGLSAFRQRQGSSVEIAVERLERLRSLADKVSPERRERWERERERAYAVRQWCGSMPDYIAERWAQYIDHGGKRPTF